MKDVVLKYKEELSKLCEVYLGIKYSNKKIVEILKELKGVKLALKNLLSRVVSTIDSCETNNETLNFCILQIIKTQIELFSESVVVFQDFHRNQKKKGVKK